MALKEAQERENLRKQAIPGLMKQEAFERHAGGADLDEEDDDL